MVTNVGVVPDTYSETVSIARVPASTQDDGLGLRLYVGPGPSHCRQTVLLEPSQVPVAYQDCLIVYIDSSKKRYISRTFYDSRLRPAQFGETHVQRQLMSEQSHISSLDHQTGAQRKWFKSAVRLTPKVFSSEVSLEVDRGTFKNVDDVTNDYEVTKVTGGVKVTSRDTRLEEMLRTKAEKNSEVRSYKSGPLVVDTSERKSLNNNDDRRENNNNYVNGLNGDIYDGDEDIYDDYINSNDIYQTGHLNGWHEKESNGW